MIRDSWSVGCEKWENLWLENFKSWGSHGYPEISQFFRSCVCHVFFYWSNTLCCIPHIPKWIVGELISFHKSAKRQFDSLDFLWLFVVGHIAYQVGQCWFDSIRCPMILAWKSCFLFNFETYFIIVIEECWRADNMKSQLCNSKVSQPSFFGKTTNCTHCFLPEGLF